MASLDDPVSSQLARLEYENAKLRKINDALMRRVERSTDLQGNAFSLFETAIALEEKVRERTTDLEIALHDLAASHAEIQRAQHEAERAQRTLADAIESVNEGFALFDADDRLVLCNQTYLSFWPAIADEIVPGISFARILTLIREHGITIGARTDPDDWIAERMEHHRIATSGHVQALTDGRWVQINELRTHDGGIVGIYTDITDVKAEDARERAHEQAQRAAILQATLDAMPEGVCLFDPNRRIITWNGAFLQMLRLTEAQVRGVARQNSLRMILDESVRSLDLSWRGTRDGESFVETTLPDGRSMAVRRSSLPGFGMILSIADITDRRRAAEALRNANETLERRVVERTSAITQVNGELQQQIGEREAAEAAMHEAKTIAEQANISKTKFLAAASHDLLQPLNAARLFVAALLDRKLETPVRGLVSQTGSALDSVEDLLESLLEISKLDAGAITPDIDVVELADLFGSMRAEFTPIAREQGITLDIAATDLRVMSDQRLLRRIIQNLLSNALRYTDTGTVMLAATRVGDTVTLSVADTGRGIAPEHHQAIFEEFRRFDQGRSHGIGLGLAIVQRAVRMLHHPIEVVSAPGNGSRFTITLPATDAHREKRALPLLRERRGVGGGLVLVIDNEPSILAAMTALLSGWGCEVVTAASGAEALAAVDAMDAHPDLIIADFHLEQEEGDTVIAAIHAAVGAKIPALIVTADRTPELRARLLAKGLQMLQKPVKPAQLRALINRLSH